MKHSLSSLLLAWMKGLYRLKCTTCLPQGVAGVRCVVEMVEGREGEDEVSRLEGLAEFGLGVEECTLQAILEYGLRYLTIDYLSAYSLPACGFSACATFSAVNSLLSLIPLPSSHHLLSIFLKHTHSLILYSSHTRTREESERQNHTHFVFTTEKLTA